MICSGTGVPPFQGPKVHKEQKMGVQMGGVPQDPGVSGGGQGPQTGAPGCADRSGV